MKLIKILLLITFISLVSAQPDLSSCSPDSGFQGSTSYSVMISGTGFDGPSPAPSADFGSGITVSAVGYILPTLLNIRVDIDILAPVGMRDIIITNEDGFADTLFDGFEVLNSDTIPPDVTLLFPSCGDTIACADSSLVFHVEDIHGFMHESIVIEVNSVEYTYLDPEISVHDDSLVVFTPSGPFDDVVDFRFVDVSDSLGYSYFGRDAPIDCRFWTDTLGPEVSDMWPPPFGSTREFSPIISMRIYDDFSGIDSSSITIRVNGSEYSWGHASLEFDGDTLKWSARDAHEEFHEGDTVRVCVVNADDRVSACGGPNPVQGDSVCWFFRIVVPPPLEINMRVNSINAEQFPYIKAKCEIFDEESRTIGHLDEDNFIVHERGDDWTRQYPIIVQDLGGGGIADIVFVIDDTGSMGGLIDDVRDGVSAFAESLAVSDINYRLGLVTFKDDVEFDEGYDLTADITEFIAWIDAIGISGGGDGPEVSLDAIYDAADSMHFRSGTQIVFIMVTDQRPHYRGDGTAFSDVLPVEVIDKVLDIDAICFNIMESSYLDMDTNYIHLAEATDGAYYDSSHFDIILSDIVDEIRGGYFISWTSSNSTADCLMRDVRIYGAYPNVRDDLDPHFVDDYDISSYHSPCSPSAMIVEPLPETYTSISQQRILMNFNEITDGIDSSSIQLVVDGDVFVPSMPQMEYIEPDLQYLPEPVDSFTHGQEILVNLARVMNQAGHYPYHGPITWRFNVDLLGPIASNPYPPDSAVIRDFTPDISCQIRDEHAGVLANSIVLAIENKETRAMPTPTPHFVDTSSEGVEWDGVTFRWHTDEAGVEFLEFDTVCVTIVRAVDNIDYGDENPLQDDGLRQWCFYIPDDDTLCPEFSNFNPADDQLLEPNMPFDISVDIYDPSGVYDDSTGSEGQGVYLLWSDDGDVFGPSAREIQLENVGGDTYQTIEPVPGQSETANFVWTVWAYDNDFELEDPLDRSGCFSEVKRIRFGLGPVSTIIMPVDRLEPLDGEVVSTLPQQEIRILVEDEELNIDFSTVDLEVNGIHFTIADDELYFIGDTLIFHPESNWDDGQYFDFYLHEASDIDGNQLQNPQGGRFFIDYSGPYISDGSLDPAPGEVTIDYEQVISMKILDRYREVDPESINLIVNDDTASFGEEGIEYNLATNMLEYDPVVRDIVFVNGDSVCIRNVWATDEHADYGIPNELESSIRGWCFMVSVTSCGHAPPVFTPNGDGYNDYVVFEYPNLASDPGIVKIFNASGIPVRELPAGQRIWDGNDDTGAPLSGGLYLYSIERRGESLCSGSVTLLR